MNPYHIYLDDKRDPKTPRDWTVVRTVEDFKSHLFAHGYPRVVSLDHDLGEEAGALTGLDAVHVLVDMYNFGVKDPRLLEFNVHSANPVGAHNMRMLWASLLKRWEPYEGHWLCSSIHDHSWRCVTL